MAKTKEGKIETYFKEQVAGHGGLTRKAKWLCRRGCPDQFWSSPEKRYGFAEIKPPDRPKLDAHQEREVRRLRNAGVLVYVISSTEDVDHFIRTEFSK